jgi:hypothetical protein
MRGRSQVGHSPVNAGLEDSVAENRQESLQGFSGSLRALDAFHCVFVSKLTHVAAAILHDVDLVAVMNRLYRRKRNTDFCPKAGNENLFAAAFFDRGDKALVVHEFMDEPSMGSCPGNTARSCCHMLPLKDFGENRRSTLFSTERGR